MVFVRYRDTSGRARCEEGARDRPHDLPGSVSWDSFSDGGGSDRRLAERRPDALRDSADRFRGGSPPSLQRL
jgi:hypothetical protein